MLTTTFFFLIFGATQWQHDVRQLIVCGYNSAINIANTKLTMFRYWLHFVKKCEFNSVFIILVIVKGGVVIDCIKLGGVSIFSPSLFTEY